MKGAKKKQRKSKIAFNHFFDVAQDFVTILDMLWEYTNHIGNVAIRTSLSNLASLPVFILTLKKKEKEIGNIKYKEHIAKVTLASCREKDKKEKLISALIYEWQDVDKIQNYRKYHDRALRILHEGILQQLVNAWEKVLGDLLSWKFKNDPGSLPENQSIKASEILSSGNIEEIKERIIHNEIRDFFRNNDSKKQLNYLKSELKIDFNKTFPHVAELEENILRRHVIVHAGGVANEEYCNKLKKITGYKGAAAKAGTLLELSPKYIKRAWAIIFSSGVITLYLAAKNHARGLSSKEDEEAADNCLINIAYENIKNKQYEAAEIILNYADKIHLVSPASKLIVRINLAQTCKWLGRHEECSRIISTQDWSACSSEFKLCIAALKGDKQNFKKFLKLAASEGKISLPDLYQWPVFKLVRKSKEFNRWVKNAFGKTLDDKEIVLTPKLLDLSPDKTIKELKKCIKLIKSSKGVTKQTVKKRKNVRHKN